MNDISLVILSAGSSTRFAQSYKKQWLRVEYEPLWLNVAKKLQSYYKFKKIIITTSSLEFGYSQRFSSDFEFVVGGDTRQDSLDNALQLVDSKFTMVTDVARACISKEMIDNLISNIDSADCVVPYLGVNDTVVYGTDTIDRDSIKLIQTPQLSDTKLLKKAINSNIKYTDDSSAIKAIGGNIVYIEGESRARKLTKGEDLSSMDCLNPPSSDSFVGSGFDVHEFEDGKSMYLGGVLIDVDYGFKAHSDGDVLIHALIDSILGAIGGGDIGELFPDSDNTYKGIDSKILLSEVVKLTNSVGFEIINSDITIIAQKPKIGEYKKKIRDSIASLLKIEPFLVNIKATTTEKLGFIGRGEGVSVSAITNVKFYNWTDKNKQR